MPFNSALLHGRQLIKNHEMLSGEKKSEQNFFEKIFKDRKLYKQPLNVDVVNWQAQKHGHFIIPTAPRWLRPVWFSLLWRWLLVGRCRLASPSSMIWEADRDSGTRRGLHYPENWNQEKNIICGFNAYCGDPIYVTEVFRLRMSNCRCCIKTVSQSSKLLIRSDWKEEIKMMLLFLCE